ncbi:Electron transfer flavoprotein-ubiquinone oxidoreductase [Mycena venus]|uniref:Electron transfer flavoprotein-ubiquinone oxidoreductase n=1 Tax=Mycena venus TaxID=2733690 RepID=A0A8H7CNC8_9AGAR|nr:Electron transfer flavoprotein-ubiquinone oxidoreductase [Mycena venus]
MLARLRPRLPGRPARSLHAITRSASSYTPYEPSIKPRKEKAVNVCIVSSSPASLSAVTRLRQLESKTGNEARAVPLEKGSEVGSHIRSGVVIEPALTKTLTSNRTGSSSEDVSLTPRPTQTGMPAAEVAFAALHPSARFVSTASPATFRGDSSAGGQGDSGVEGDHFHGAVRYCVPRLPTSQRPLGRVQCASRIRHTPRSVVRRFVRGDGHDSRGQIPWTFKHHPPIRRLHAQTNPSTTSPDALSSRPTSDSSCKPMMYPRFEPPLRTDLMSSVALTGTNHSEAEAVHLRVMRGVKGAALGADSPFPSPDASKPDSTTTEADADTTENPARRRTHVRVNAGTYASLLQRARPAGVYEYVADDRNKVVPGNVKGKDAKVEGGKGTELIINSQNCIHCKLCDFKVPT